jgi:hypothetical protein
MAIPGRLPDNGELAALPGLPCRFAELLEASCPAVIRTSASSSGAADWSVDIVTVLPRLTAGRSCHVVPGKKTLHSAFSVGLSLARAAATRTQVPNIRRKGVAVIIGKPARSDKGKHFLITINANNHIGRTANKKVTIWIR